LTLTAKGEIWTVSIRTVADWLAGVAPADAGGYVSLGLDREKVETYLAARASSVAVVPKNAAFEEKEGKVMLFEPSVDGETLDVNGAMKAIEHALFGEPASEKGAALELPIASVPPAMTTEASNPYGIKEIIGIGSTNFKGSPKNRRHNIAVGAKSVDGSLIAPGEEFSLLKTLGKIDGTTGYLQELVIKENKTKPEYGGGLCQIGSTTFRAVLASGLPVTARRNHSYRVPYYERDGDGSTIGPGKDATIYDPAPDFKFRNDTGHHILIKTTIEGNKLSFIFWGVRDGRTAEQTSARVYNIKAPPPKLIVETDDLKPGEEKCTEHAHVGSDAVFTYTVTYADGTVKTQDIYSHYKPWQEVCLVGRDPNAPPAGSGTPDDGVPPSSDAAGATGN
jgi:vancomycin resistance protein YoaR